MNSYITINEMGEKVEINWTWWIFLFTEEKEKALFVDTFFLFPWLCVENCIFGSPFCSFDAEAFEINEMEPIAKIFQQLHTNQILHEQREVGEKKRLHKYKFDSIHEQTFERKQIQVARVFSFSAILCARQNYRERKRLRRKKM